MARTTCTDKLKVLADPNRFNVIQLLMDGEFNVCVLSSKLGIEQSLLSHHLRTLRDSGLITSRRQGKGVLYGLAEDVHLPGEGDQIDLGCCRLTFNPSEDGRDS